MFQDAQKYLDCHVPNKKKPNNNINKKDTVTHWNKQMCNNTDL